MTGTDHDALIGFTCAYAPLPLIHAAGFVPRRILPEGDAPDQAGTLVHDSMCPHVKRVLDRGIAGQLPDLAGVVFVNSCDAMRRLADAWRLIRPGEPSAMVDLPISTDDRAVEYLADQLERLRLTLGKWRGVEATDDQIHDSARLYGELTDALGRLTRASAAGRLHGGREELQVWLNRSVSQPPEQTLGEVEALALDSEALGGGEVPVFVFGNMLSDPEAYGLVEQCGARVVGDDLCTGARQIAQGPLDPACPPLPQLARQIMSRPACARTLSPGRPGGAGEQVVTGARSSQARGVIAHVMKFCDPYLARMPSIRTRLKEAGLPLLVLEGDCTLRSLGQHRTRIEAFVEMLT